MPPAQQRHIKKMRTLVGRELPDLIRRNQLAHDARKEKTLSGALRRAVHECPQSPLQVAEMANISWSDLDDFLTGEQTLPSDAMDRLAKVLKLNLPTRRSRGTARAG